jgi:hypothetical protein
MNGKVANHKIRFGEDERTFLSAVFSGRRTQILEGKF